MISVVGVTFRNEGKIIYFDPNSIEMVVGSHVIADTERGTGFATVIMPPKEVDEKHVRLPLYKILRLATDEDEKIYRENNEKEKEAYRICREKIEIHSLEMKLVDVEYMFDRSKVIFYFTADGRVDFRELIKDLAGILRTRIELRQIGVRDETKLVGGFGICGRPLCCNMYMNEFAPVSIKMAKEQNLSLNPTKISGACGRLMCCLKNEQETYEYLNSKLPNVGAYVTTPDGLKGEVSSVSVLRQRVKVLVEVDDEKEIREYQVDELSFRSRRKDNDLSEEEKQQLKEEGFDSDKLEEKDSSAGDGKSEDGENGNNRKNRNRNDRYSKNGNRENRDNKDNRDKKDNRENKEYRDNRDNKDNRENRDNGESKENRDNKENKENRDNKENKDNRDGRNRKYNRRDYKKDDAQFIIKDDAHGDTGRRSGNAEGQKKEGFNKDRSKDFVREQNKDKNIDKNHYRDKNQEQGKNFHNKNFKNRNKNYNGNRKGGNGGNGGDGHRDGGNEG